MDIKKTPIFKYLSAFLTELSPQHVCYAFRTVNDHQRLLLEEFAKEEIYSENITSDGNWLAF